jgi:hypothetical protein
VAFDPLKLAQQHPVETGLGVVAVGVLLWLMLGQGGGSSASSGQAQLASAYYGAQSADAQAGDAVQIATINAQAATTQALASDATQSGVNSTWASTDLAEVQSNNASAATLAPYAVQSQAVGALTSALQAPNVVSTKQTAGFLGFGRGSSTTVSPNPIAINASAELAGLINGFNAGH